MINYPEIQSIEETKTIETPEIKYRFKTKEEFDLDGKWDHIWNSPANWERFGAMNKYLGKELDSNQQFLVRKMFKERNMTIHFDGWTFNNYNFIEIGKAIPISIPETKKPDPIDDWAFEPKVYIPPIPKGYEAHIGSTQVVSRIATPKKEYKSIITDGIIVENTTNITI